MDDRHAFVAMEYCFVAPFFSIEWKELRIAKRCTAIYFIIIYIAAICNFLAYLFIIRSGAIVHDCVTVICSMYNLHLLCTTPHC